MRSSKFVDKQITELSRPHSQDFSLFLNPHHHNDDDNSKEFSPTFRFHLIRPVASTQSHVDDFESLIFVIDRKMKELGENLMHAVEGISAHLTQLENQTRRIENSFDNLKDSIESCHGSSDGKLRELHNFLTKVYEDKRLMQIDFTLLFAIYDNSSKFIFNNIVTVSLEINKAL